MFPGPLMFKSVTPITLTFTETPNSGVGLTEYTFSGASISTAAANRKVVVCVAGGFGTVTVSALTVGGIAGTLVGRQAGGAYTVEIWEAAVPTGTTADIVVTWSGAQSFCSCGIYAMYGAAAAYSAVAMSTAAPLSAAVAVPFGGASIAIGHTADAATATWTELTEDFDEREDPVTFAARMSGASKAYGMAGGSSPTVECAWTASTGPAMVLASWAPG